MIYPDNFEHKIGFDQIRTMLRGECLCSLGKEMVDEMAFTANVEIIRESLRQVNEFRQVLQKEDFPLQSFFDMRQPLARLRIEGTHLEVEELHHLGQSLATIKAIKDYLCRTEGDTILYPTLHTLTLDITTFSNIIKDIRRIIDKNGDLMDSASPELARIRHELSRSANSISGILQSVMRRAINEGIVDKDVTPAIRDGRLVIPIAPSQRRRLRGIVHDESSSGKTVFVEPEEAVEANNRIRELENEERREIIRILTAFADEIRPYAQLMTESFVLLAKIDFIRAKALMANFFCATEPQVEDKPDMLWTEAAHPLLKMSLAKQGRNIVKQEIELKPDARLLIISGPNAGGKSVCLKTVGLLQYMLQCGLSITVGERSLAGVFTNIMIDIGDEQSIDDDLSTYSGHLRNMKTMIRRADNHTLLLIDEMGTGTEPQIGGAIAEAIAKQFANNKVYGIITTHYQNLKHFADATEGVVNGAMLYDRHEMRPLFQLAIGRPGSSFAIEIARQTGLPDEVIRYAGDIVGSDYIQSDKYLQDIVRDKRYWENKRQSIHQREKELEAAMTRYEERLREVEQKRKDIITKAKSDAAELLNESNRQIENTIKDIRQAQAEKEETRRIRQELEQFREAVLSTDSTDSDEALAKKIKQIEERRARHKKRQEEKRKNAEGKLQKTELNATTVVNSEQAMLHLEFTIGDSVRINGTTTVGTISEIKGNTATVEFGSMRTKLPLNKIEKAKETASQVKRNNLGTYNISKTTRTTIDEHRDNFRQDLDVRGLRGDEAINAVMYFIDDAILAGMPRVRILHGKGNGILRQLIRQYLQTVPAVTHFADEHVQFGGAGITVVDL